MVFFIYFVMDFTPDFAYKYKFKFGSQSYMPLVDTWMKMYCNFSLHFLNYTLEMVHGICVHRYL